MSRTHRTSSRSYYGRDIVPLAERKLQSQPGAEHYRHRWFLGYDGGISGRVADCFRVTDGDLRFSYADKGAGRERKRHLKRRASKLRRKLAKTQLCLWVGEQGDDHPVLFTGPEREFGIEPVVLGLFEVFLGVPVVMVSLFGRDAFGEHHHREIGHVDD